MSTDAAERHFERPPSRCRICGYASTCAYAAMGDPRSPQADDVDICFNCGAVAIYTETLDRRPPTDAERAELTVGALTAIRRIRERGRIA